MRMSLQKTAQCAKYLPENDDVPKNKKATEKEKEEGGLWVVQDKAHAEKIISEWEEDIQLIQDRIGMLVGPFLGSNPT